MDRVNSKQSIHYKTYFSGNKLTHFDCKKTLFLGGNFDNTILIDSDFSEVKVWLSPRDETYMAMQNAILCRVNFKDADLWQVNFTGSRFEQVTFTNTKLHKPDFTNAYLSEQDLSDVKVIKDANYTGANCWQTKLSQEQKDLAEKQGACLDKMPQTSALRSFGLYKTQQSSNPLNPLPPYENSSYHVYKDISITTCKN